MTVKSITVEDGKLITVKEEEPAEITLQAVGALIAIAVAIKQISVVKHPRWQIAGVALMIGSFLLRNIVIVKKFVDAK